MNILSEIIASKKKRISNQGYRPLARMREHARAVRSTAEGHALVKALSNERINVIAEFKRRSPSKGVIRDDVSPESMARYYESGGAAAISVLTEEDYFGGSLQDLKAVRAAVSLPVLRKDFIFDEYQVYETAAGGADALLLIVSVLDDEALVSLRELAEDELEMVALVEVHTKAEMQRAIASGARFIGVNNRDLKTFSVSVETSVELAREAPADGMLVSESGINSAHDLRRLQSMGYQGFLIGESLMRSPRPNEALLTLIREAETAATG
ncbi:indole-3-glycerol phosphate synthase TrpC [soil metagenome]